MPATPGPFPVRRNISSGLVLKALEKLVKVDKWDLPHAIYALSTDGESVEVWAERQFPLAVLKDPARIERVTMAFGRDTFSRQKDRIRRGQSPHVYAYVYVGEAYGVTRPEQGPRSEWDRRKIHHDYEHRRIDQRPDREEFRMALACDIDNRTYMMEYLRERPGKVVIPTTMSLERGDQREWWRMLRLSCLVAATELYGDPMPATLLDEVEAAPVINLFADRS